jgi:hypothetical protein
MGKPRKHTSVRDMSEPVKRSKRKAKPPSYRGGIAGRGAPVTEVPPAERDWYAEGRCATCHRETPRKLLTRNVTLEDKALCGKCFDRVPTHLRRLPTPNGHKRWTPASGVERYERDQKTRKKENRALLDAVPGTTIEEKLDTVGRGIAVDEEPRPVWDPTTRRLLHEPEPRHVEPVELWRCDHRDCGFTGTFEATAKHGQSVGHLFRSRLAVE